MDNAIGTKVANKSTERSRRLRQKMASASFTEVRGVYAKTEDHNAIKQMIRDYFTPSLPTKKSKQTP